MANELPKGAVWRGIILAAIASTVGGIGALWLIWTVIEALK
jgi:hypothetical protein